MMRAFVFLALFILIAENVLSQEITWPKGNDVINVTENLYLLKAPADSLGIEQISTDRYQDQFRILNNPVISLGFTQSVYWLRFSLNNQTADSLWLEFEHAYIPHVTLFLRNSKGVWTSYDAGYKVKLADKVIKNHFQVFPLQPGKHEYFVKIIPLVHPIPVKIWNSKVYQMRADRQRIVYGIYSGLLFFAIIINIFLFILFRRNYYFLYALLVFLYECASAGVMEGYVIYYLPNSDLMDWYRIVPVLNMPVFLLYCISFLELKKASPRLYKITMAVSLMLSLYILTGLQFWPLLTVLFINYILALIVFIIAIINGIVVGRKGNRIGSYFAIAYSIWFILLVFEEVYIQTGKPSHVFQLSYVSIAIFIEAFLLAFLLVKRFQWEKREEEKLRFDLQANLITVKQKFEQEKIQTRLEIREHTFQNISQEIHDNVAQTLSLAKLNLSTIHDDFTAEEQAKVTEAKNLVAKAIHDLRDIAKAINTDYIKSIGLTGAIDQQLKILRKSGIFKITYIVRGDEEMYDSSKELFVFRIIQELLNNVVKHANADMIELIIEYHAEEVTIRVADNGRGFDVNGLVSNQEKGLGLASIRDRAKLIGGQLLISSERGKGTKIILSVPKISM
jgi:signal transduction histidine kinase